MGTTTTSGIKTNGTTAAWCYFKLTTGGALTIGTPTSTAAHSLLDALPILTLNVTGAVTQTAGNVITANGLQLLGSGTVNLDEATNNVATIGANYDASIS